MTLSLDGSVSYDTHTSMYVEDHLTLSPEDAVSHDTHNAIYVEGYSL